MTEHRFLDVTDGASYAGVCRRTFQDWILKGLLPAYKPTGKLLVDREELEDFIRSSRANRTNKNQDLSALATAAVSAVTGGDR